MPGTDYDYSPEVVGRKISNPEAFYESLDYLTDDRWIDLKINNGQFIEQLNPISKTRIEQLIAAVYQKYPSSEERRLMVEPIKLALEEVPVRSEFIRKPNFFPVESGTEAAKIGVQVGSYHSFKYFLLKQVSDELGSEPHSN
ncbi:hypothetical protein ACQ4M3_37350 [Leptolyngbya sp. AN03gr2]|uniref:hypothetical protein n=1 Tax=unclassified Leptolyngbya TaxID=2650499 RepID=UPI003D32146D